MPEPDREYHYQVDRDGRIFHDGAEIIDPAVQRFFLRAMTRTDDGRSLVLCQGERNWFDAADTPFVVQRLRLDVSEVGLRGAELCFLGDYREPLDPRTLETEHDLLFCRVRGGAFRARFGRVATQQLAPFLVGTAQESALLLGGDRHPVRRRARTAP
ncbi:MAG TPA: hypothetical protein VIG07_03920 [Methylomirabilota bacterium]|jgi:hypothetical protein